MFHLDKVAELVQPFGETAEVIAYLHDVAEDTPVSIDEIRSEFGMFVADCVALLTDLPGATRKERKAKTYARMSAIQGPTELALLVKTADRLANVRSCVADRKQSMWEMYKGEHPTFRAAVHRQGLCDALWIPLDDLLTSWPETAS